MKICIQMNFERAAKIYISQFDLSNSYEITHIYNSKIKLATLKFIKIYIQNKSSSSLFPFSFSKHNENLYSNEFWTSC